MTTKHEQEQREAEITTRMTNDIHALTGMPIAKINCRLDKTDGSWEIELHALFNTVIIDMVRGEYAIRGSSAWRDSEHTIEKAQLLLKAAKIVDELLEVNHDHDN